MLRVRLWLWAMTLLLSAGMVSARADEPGFRQPPIDLVVAQAPLSVSGHLEAMRDPTGQMTLADALSAAFFPVPLTLGAGYTSDAVWVRFRLRQPGPDAGHWILDLLPPIIDRIDLYIATTDNPHGPEDFQRQSIGSMVPVRSHRMANSNLLVSFDLPPDATREVYARVTSATVVGFRGSIFDDRSLAATIKNQSLFHGLIYGSFALVVIFNVLWFVWMREVLNLYYAGYVLSLLVNHLAISNILAALLPEIFAPGSKLWMSISNAGSLTCGALFVVAFLRLREKAPWGRAIILTFGALSPLTVIPVLFGDYRSGATTGQFIGLALIIADTSVSVKLALRGDILARRFLIAFAPALCGGVVSIMRALGLTPNTWWTEQFYFIASLLHIVLMNISMMTRMRDAESARREAQATALAASHAAEERALRIIDEQTRELVTAKREVEAALAAERQAVKDQIQFIDMIGHEYRTPMSVIRAGIDVMELSAAMPNPPDKSLLDRMRRSADRLVKLIEVGLQRDRFDQPGIAIDPRPLDLARLAREVVMELPLDGPDVLVHAPEPVPVHADLFLLRTVVINLLDNARKYGGVEKPIEITVGMEGRVAVLRITDRGPGIPPSAVPHIFDKYYRAPRARTVVGIGLGLYLAHKIAILHMGKLELESADAGQCTFRLRLPAFANPVESRQ